MKRVPEVLLEAKSVPERKSNAERKIFELLKAVDIGPECVAFHSLNCSEHQYKQWSEIDFLLIDHRVALVLEVKGGRVRFEGGKWLYTDRFDQEDERREGPFEQANSAMHALRKMLVEKYKFGEIVGDGLLFGFGIVFPDIDWDLDTVEMPRQLVADRRECATSEQFKRYLLRLVNYWSEKLPHKRGLQPAQFKEVKAKLRPDVDVYPPFSARIGYAIDAMQRMTEEQYGIVDIIDDNDRVIVTGGAGTGKTFLMLQAARRSASAGLRVLVVVHSRILAAHLRRLEPDPAIEIRAFDRLRDLGTPNDILFVDEGQDLLSFAALDTIGRHLVGGLDHGRWRWFMDENNQSSVAGDFDREALEYLRGGLQGGRPVSVPLRKNVRNTIQIARKVQYWTGADIGRAELTGHGGQPKLHKLGYPEEEPHAASSVIEVLLANGVEAQEIGIVLSSSADPQTLEKLNTEIRALCVKLDTSTVTSDLRGRIVAGPAAAFKGLERPIIVALGFHGADYCASKVNELYVALTRANFAFHVFADAALCDAFKKNEAKNQPIVTGAA